jgi:hypothetical protein
LSFKEKTWIVDNVFNCDSYIVALNVAKIISVEVTSISETGPPTDSICLYFACTVTKRLPEFVYNVAKLPIAVNTEESVV